jgi:multidrug efflux system membrane fusion protein
MKNRFLLSAFLVTAALSLSACKKDGEGAQGGPGGGMPQAEVTVLKTEPKDIELSDVLPGRVAAFRTAEIRPQVSGIIKQRLFEQGTEVTQGQVLFQIDPAPFEADRKAAEAAVKRAQATLTRASAQAGRYKELVAADAISKQAYDDALATELEAQADVIEAKATLDRRTLDLKFASVDAPIPGRIDQAIVTEGALVSPTDTNAMAVVQQIDQVFVDVRQPASRLQAVRDAAMKAESNPSAHIDILSEDGKEMSDKGQLLFSGVSVDPETGEVLTRVQVPNENRVLLPGMYVQARLPLKKIDQAIMVPQQSVKHLPNGQAVVSIVEDGGKWKEVQVKTGGIQNGMYVIETGLKGGENVVVEGLDKLMPDAPVKTVPWKDPSVQPPAATGAQPAAEAQPPAMPAETKDTDTNEGAE